MTINLSKNKKDLETIIEVVSTTKELLVASDFDGTISDFTENPDDASISPIALLALKKLAGLPHTSVSVISGRSLNDLSLKLSEITNIHLVGSHGHEFGPDLTSESSDEEKEILKQAEAFVRQAVANCPGSRIELKPHGVAFHFRGLPTSPIDEINALRTSLNGLKEGLIRDGNQVLEYSIVATNKGDALGKIIKQLSPTLTFFIGDDVTDEEAFKRLSPSDISIKVGDAITEAHYRIISIEQAVEFLSALADRRAAFLSSSVTKAG